MVGLGRSDLGGGGGGANSQLSKYRFARRQFRDSLGYLGGWFDDAGGGGMVLLQHGFDVHHGV